MSKYIQMLINVLQLTHKGPSISHLKWSMTIYTLAKLLFLVIIFVPLVNAGKFNSDNSLILFIINVCCFLFWQHLFTHTEDFDHQKTKVKKNGFILLNCSFILLLVYTF